MDSNNEFLVEFLLKASSSLDHYKEAFSALGKLRGKAAVAAAKRMIKWFDEMGELDPHGPAEAQRILEMRDCCITAIGNIAVNDSGGDILDTLHGIREELVEIRTLKMAELGFQFEEQKGEEVKDKLENPEKPISVTDIYMNRRRNE